MRYLPTEALLDGLPHVLWKEVDEGWIRFDPAAAQTLLLTPIARFVLERVAIAGASAGVGDLVAAVLREEPEAGHDACRSLVEAALQALVEAHLIRPSAP